MLRDNQQAMVCAILRRRHPRAARLQLPKVAEVTNPFQTKRNHPKVPVLSADSRLVGRMNITNGKTPVVIDSSAIIRCANTGRTLWIAPGSHIDNINTGAAEQLNPTYQPSQHQLVADHRKVTQ
ncbi:hypothetical protein [Aeromonas hydrophila]|uniref:hypothetical protein n=1 Tax=Aeromonas hydrophila TaxID=644 RepID=UPI002B485444|nr:hypothetical protein [Aeromonas hydrophila]